MESIELELRAGDLLRLEGPDGRVIEYAVTQIAASFPASGPDWVTTSPGAGRVRLRLHPREWAQDVSDAPKPYLLPEELAGIMAGDNLQGWSEEDAAPEDAERVIVLGPVN